MFNRLIKRFSYLKVFFTPFVRPKVKFYLGKIKFGTPYFLPRKWVKMTRQQMVDRATKDILNSKSKYYGKPLSEVVERYIGAQVAVPKKIGFDFVSLGWKSKWSADDYRFEWPPSVSFVFFKWQFCIFFEVPHPDHYWTAWLYYENDTSKHLTKKERIEQCKIGFPLDYIRYYNNTEEKINYYDYILK